MAQKVQTVLVDDLTGEPAGETVQFGLQGRHYEIDLSRANAKELRSLLKPYVRASRTAAPARDQEAARIRRWAQENGYSVSVRGRIHQKVIEAYYAVDN